MLFCLLSKRYILCSVLDYNTPLPSYFQLQNMSTFLPISLLTILNISEKSMISVLLRLLFFFCSIRKIESYLFCIQVITLRYTSDTFGVYCLFVICKSRLSRPFCKPLLSLSVYNHYLYFDSGWSPVPLCDKIKGQKVSFLLFPLKIFIYKQYIVYPPLPVGRKASIARRNYAYLL